MTIETPSSLYDSIKQKRRTWVVTGAAGFIGSNLVETLLRLDQNVVGLDNFSTGYQKNLDEVQQSVSSGQWENFTFHEGDIRNMDDCQKCLKNTDYVLHQAALGSVPRSLEDPLTTNSNNINGFLNMLIAARDAKVRRFVYAASSSTYGDHPGLPKLEEHIGQPLSPYAVTKYVNELYAGVFEKCYDFSCIGLRYFNVFGPRQDPDGAYAAVIPKWFDTLIKGQQPQINGDGETSRDFCYIDNTVQANLAAAMAEDPEAAGQVYNIAYGERTTLKELFTYIKEIITVEKTEIQSIEPNYMDFRPGDVRHSLADIGKARNLLGYAPQISVKDGLERAAAWYFQQS